MSLYIQLLCELRARGAGLWVEAGELKVSAPTGVLDDLTRAMLRDSRAAIIDVLDRYRAVKTRLARGMKKDLDRESVESSKLEAAESLIEDSIVAFIDGDASIETVALAWKALTSLFPKSPPQKTVQTPALSNEPSQASFPNAR